MQTTVVGNYPKIPNRPRPARLRQAINRRDRGEITSEELARIEDEVTVEVIGEQLSDEYGSKRRAWRAALRAKTVRPADAEPLRCLRRELTSWPVDRSPVGTTPRQRVGCKEGIPIDGACSRLMAPPSLPELTSVAPMRLGAGDRHGRVKQPRARVNA